MQPQAERPPAVAHSLLDRSLVMRKLHMSDDDDAVIMQS